MVNIVLLAFGRESDYRRTIISVFSFWTWYSGKSEDIKYLLYTDKPQYFHEYFKEISIEYYTLTTAKLEAMLGGSNFFLRMKIAVIDETFQQYPNNKLIFIDSDTFFISDPLQWIKGLSIGISYMHVCEYKLEEGLTFAAPKEKGLFIKWLENRNFIINKKEKNFDRHNSSWNSGVIGLTKESATFLTDVYIITDEIYKFNSWHISEQLAFTFVLQTVSEIKASDQYVFHYWYSKDIIDGHISNILENDFLELPLSRKLNIIKKFTKEVNFKLKSIEAFNLNKFVEGYSNAWIAIKSMPLNKRSIADSRKYLKDICYHTFRFVKSKIQ